MAFDDSRCERRKHVPSNDNDNDISPYRNFICRLWMFGRTESADARWCLRISMPSAIQTASLNENEIKTVSFSMAVQRNMYIYLVDAVYLWEFSICLRIPFDRTEPTVNHHCFHFRYYRQWLSSFSPSPSLSRHFFYSFSHVFHSNQIYLLWSFSVKINNLVFDKNCENGVESLLAAHILCRRRCAHSSHSFVILVSTAQYAFHESSNQKYFCKYLSTMKRMMREKRKIIT